MKANYTPERIVLSDQLEWFRYVIGLPFVFIGLLCIHGLITGDLTREGEPISLYEAPIFILILAAGLAMSFGQRRLIFDGHSRTVTFWVGALLPIWKQTLAWSAVDEVAIEALDPKPSSPTIKRLFVTVEGPQGKLKSGEMRDEIEVGQIGRRVATLMKRPLRNAVDGTFIPFEDLHGSLGQRLRRQNPEPGDIPAPPEGVSVDRLGSKLWIRCEPPGVSQGKKIFFYLQMGLTIVITLPILITVLFGLFSKSVESGLQLALIPFILLLLGFAVSLRLSHYKLQRAGDCEEELELTPTELTLRRKIGSQSTTHRVATEDLDALELDKNGLLILTQTESLVLSAGADGERRSWLRRALETHLSQTAAP